MASDSRHAEYLAKAKDAETRAAAARDEETRRNWATIAQNYRALARRYVELQKPAGASLRRFHEHARQQR